MKKSFALILALVLVVTAVAGGTIAWLTATSGTVTNTFTVGDIEISLAETTGETYKIIPGSVAAKDPKVSVTADSEACYLFVRIQETNNTMPNSTEKLVNYTVNSGWTPVPNQTGYYYREVSATDAKTGVSYYVFAGNTTYANGYVSYNENITKNQVTESNKPVITITAAAIQSENIQDVATAFSKLPTEFTA